MLESIVHWLDTISSFVLWSCVALIVLVNGAAAVVFVNTRSRDLVNRWTGRLLATNALLIGSGVGVPVVSYVAKVAVQTVAPAVTTRVTPSVAPSADVPAAEVVPRQ